MTDPCPCGSGLSFETCCGPYLDGKPAPTAEALMRSRYTAYARNDMAHLERTLGSRQRAAFRPAETLAWSADVVWTGLTVLATLDGGPDDDTGVVEFSATFEKAGEPMTLHERSRFKKKNGCWLYVDSRPGSTDPAPAPAAPKVGRNDSCPCGSGKKYKRCCGR
ncbi:YchJ family protein [Solidesulfovibrio sp. C21]|uniref:YchJ family protein n=1 Tax=Solidesulfovibrio sp. C21 TaxID=3398613 RepID=UPI0039FC8FD6